MKYAMLSAAVGLLGLAGVSTASAQTVYVQEGYAPGPYYYAPSPTYVAPPAAAYVAPPASGYVVDEPNYVVTYPAPAYARPPAPIGVAPAYDSGMSYAADVGVPACGWDGCD